VLDHFFSSTKTSMMTKRNCRPDICSCNRTGWDFCQIVSTAAAVVQLFLSQTPVTNQAIGQSYR